MLGKVGARLHRLFEAVAVGLLAIIFLAFMAQIALRYVFNWPVGWTTEVSLIAWLWLVLLGTAVVLKDSDEIRLDLVPEHAGRGVRIAAGALGSVVVIVLFAISLPATWSYVSFMKVEKSSYLGIRMDVLYSVYMLFAVAVIVRHLAALARLLRGRPPELAPHVPHEP